MKLADLIDEPWTLPHVDNAASALIAEIFRASNLELPRIRVFCNSIQMHNALLARGPFLAIFPRSLLHFGQLPVKVLPVDLPNCSGPVGIIRLRNRTMSPVARMFLETTREVVKPLA
jgi:DNA-binding transcriptional LysR family regulator